MKNSIVAIVLFISTGVGAQVSVIGGLSSLIAYGNPTPYAGIHLGLEIPRDDAVSFYGKFTHHFSQSKRSPYLGFATANDVTNPVNFQSFDYNVKMNYNILEGGTRYYLGNGFDYGFGAYGGTSMKLIFNGVSPDYELNDNSAVELNSEDYTVDPDFDFKGSIFSIGAGLGGGVKYSFARYGTFYFDMSIDYIIFSQQSNNFLLSEVYPQTGERQWSPLIFSVSLGYRKDILW
jgi:hypothetical protein